MAEESEPLDLMALYRVAASHALECAMDDSTEAHIIFDIAQHKFRQMFRGHVGWPERRILH